MPSPRKAQASQPAETEMSSRKKIGRQQGIAREGSRREGNAGHEAHHQGQTEKLSGHLKFRPRHRAGGI